jgi:hypothetical protein
MMPERSTATLTAPMRFGADADPVFSVPMKELPVAPSSHLPRPALAASNNCRAGTHFGAQ